MFRSVDLDFVDVVTQADTHRLRVELAALNGVDVICQKPVASALSSSCDLAGLFAIRQETGDI